MSSERLRTHRLWYLALVALAALAALALAGCGSDDDETVSVRLALDWIPWSNHSGLYIAQEKGYFADEGIDITIYVPNDPATTLLVVAAGQDDFGLTYQSEVLLAAQQGVPITSVAAFVQHPLNSIMTLESSALRRPGDLAGKTIGAYGVPSDGPLLDTMLKSDGIGLDDVELVNVGFDLVPALISGQVDAIIGAYWVAESISAANQGFPVNVMRMEEWGVPDFYEIVLVTSQEKVAQDPELVQRFVRAVMRGYEDALSDPQAAITLLARSVPEIDESIERLGIDLLLPYWRDGDNAFGWQSAARWNSFATWMQEQGLLGDPGDMGLIFTNRFVEGAR
jgi:putative hydroxymethylpyrimidine transport system substrate-binding protein